MKTQNFKAGYFSLFLLFLLGIFSVSACKKTDDSGKTGNNTFNGKVIIIGAGASGLAAAKKCEEQGIEWEIIEATDHYGGRVQKNEDFADFPIDIGAEWIHADKSILNTLIGSDDSEPDVETVLYQPMDVYNFDGTTYKKESGLVLQIAYSMYKEYKFKNTTWYDYLSTHFAKDIADKITYNTKVTSIDYSGDQVKIITDNNQEYLADKVILTVSVGVLKSNAITFTPALSQKKQDAIESVEFLPGFKLFMKFSEKFYPDMVNCETSSGEKTFYDVAYHKGAQDHVFGLLSTGESTLEYYQLGSEQQIVQKVLNELDYIYNGQASQYYTGEYLIKDWGKHVFTNGTWTSNGASNSTLKTLNQPLDNKVYFAGATYNLDNERSTVHGAILSGYEAVNKILNE